ncbi:MAG: metalloregulator ArsR/SmtB family transcription factor, partial [Acidobacteriota bacterium]|nr:metalloregulator ArsR/SmtB family transcription factor [Acidobacteriota bacterium]
MHHILALTKALNDQSRLRLLMATRRGELCLCQLIELLGLAPSTVSKHMTILQQAGLVDRRQEGRWAFYRLADEDAPEET